MKNEILEIRSGNQQKFCGFQSFGKFCVVDIPDQSMLPQKVARFFDVVDKLLAITIDFIRFYLPTLYLEQVMWKISLPVDDLL